MYHPPLYTAEKQQALSSLIQLSQFATSVLNHLAENTPNDKTLQAQYLAHVLELSKKITLFTTALQNYDQFNQTRLEQIIAEANQLVTYLFNIIVNDTELRTLTNLVNTVTKPIASADNGDDNTVYINLHTKNHEQAASDAFNIFGLLATNNFDHRLEQAQFLWSSYRYLILTLQFAKILLQLQGGAAQEIQPTVAIIDQQNTLYQNLWRNAQTLLNNLWQNPFNLQNVRGVNFIFSELGFAQQNQHNYLTTLAQWLTTKHTAAKLAAAQEETRQEEETRQKLVAATQSNSIAGPASPINTTHAGGSAPTPPTPTAAATTNIATPALARATVIDICEVLGGRTALQAHAQASKISVMPDTHLVQFAFKNSLDRNNFTNKLTAAGIQPIKQADFNGHKPGSFFGWTPSTSEQYYAVEISIQAVVKLWGLNQLANLQNDNSNKNKVRQITDTNYEAEMLTAIKTALQQGTSIITAANQVHEKFKNDNSASLADEFNEILCTLAKAERRYTQSEQRLTWDRWQSRVQIYYA